MSKSPPKPLDYRPPVDNRPVVSVPFARKLLVAACIPAPVGIALLVLGKTAIAGSAIGLGAAWLLFGGLLTAVTALAAFVGFVGSFRRRGEVRRARLLFAGTMVMGLISVLTAVACVVLGGEIADQAHFTIELSNTTTQQVTAVFHFDSGDVSVGPVAPGGTVESEEISANHQGPLLMTVRSVGRTATTQVSEYEDNDDLHFTMHFDVTPEDFAHKTP